MPDKEDFIMICDLWNYADLIDEIENLEDFYHRHTGAPISISLEDMVSTALICYLNCLTDFAINHGYKPVKEDK